MKSMAKRMILITAVFGFISFKTIFAASVYNILRPKGSKRAIPVAQNISMSEHAAEPIVQMPVLSGELTASALPVANPLHGQQGIDGVDLGGVDDRETLGKPTGVFEIFISKDGSIQVAGTEIDALGESARDLIVPFIKRDCKISPLLPIGEDADPKLVPTTNGQSVEECAYQVVEKVSANGDEIASLRDALTATRLFIQSHEPKERQKFHTDLEQRCLVPFGANELNVQECTECIRKIGQPNMRAAQ